MSSPKLITRRVVVTGDYSLDQPFLPGINVIYAKKMGNDPRSTNSCGKTSLVELIQHGFGKTQGSKTKYFFAPIMDKLGTLFLEFETDNGIFTVERSLQTIMGAVRLHEGVYVPGIERSPAESVSVDDMSDLMLDLVGIPKVSIATSQGETTPLSFRLLMRAFIMHQEDSFAEILFKILPESRKTDILGFLTRMTPMERYPIEEKLSKLRQEEEPLENYISQIRKFFVENKIPSIIDAGLLVQEATQAVEIEKQELFSLQQSITLGQSERKPGHTDYLRKKLFSIKENINQLEQQIDGLSHEEIRIQELINSLHVDRNKSAHIQSSTAQLSSIEFKICPRCMQELDADMRQRENTGRCMLCNRPLILTSDSLPTRLPKTDDLNMQIKEAEELRLNLHNEITFIETSLKDLRQQELGLGNELDKELSAYVSPIVDQLIVQTNRVSEKQAELSKAQSIQAQMSTLEEKQDSLNKMKKDLAGLQDELEENKKLSYQRREEFRQIFEKILRDVDYPDLNEVSLEPQSLMPKLNGQLYNHQGTAFKALVTVCYHLGMFSLARNENTWFPKFLVIDSPNAGDLNEDNHTKLLRFISGIQNNSIEKDPDWQIILTTRLLIPELEPFVRQEISNPNMMLLRKR